MKYFFNYIWRVHLQKQITFFFFLQLSKIMFFHCAFQLISIKLQLGYFDEVKTTNIQLTNTIKQKHDNIKKTWFWKKNKIKY